MTVARCQALLNLYDWDGSSSYRKGSKGSMNLHARPWQDKLSDEGYGEAASAHNKQLSMHRWANWIAGFSGEFARSAISKFIPDYSTSSDIGGTGSGPVVLDPFAGVGTTLVEANRLGLSSIGFEINPFAALVCNVKLQAASVSLPDLAAAIEGYIVYMRGGKDQEPRSTPPPGFKTRIPFYSPIVERKVLFTLDYLNGLHPQIRDLFLVAFTSVMVDFSNYSYEPSLGTRPGAGKSLIDDANVEQILEIKLRQMIEDIAELQTETGASRREDSRCIPVQKWRVYESSFLEAADCISPKSVDLVVTSPPYMNNYHYVRNSRPQLFWTGLVQSSSELKKLETGNFGKFWQTVRGQSKIPLNPYLPQLEKEIAELRAINQDRGVYGGNGWANYVTSYMNDLDLFCEKLADTLKPGGTAVIVVGNSIVQGKEFKVEEYLSEIAELRGLTTINVTRLRDRVGSSIVNTGARLRSEKRMTLYDAAVAIRQPG